MCQCSVTLVTIPTQAPAVLRCADISQLVTLILHCPLRSAPLTKHCSDVSSVTNSHPFCSPACCVDRNERFRPPDPLAQVSSLLSPGLLVLGRSVGSSRREILLQYSFSDENVHVYCTTFPPSVYPLAHLASAIQLQSQNCSSWYVNVIVCPFSFLNMKDVGF